MATVEAASELSKYFCNTQEEEDPSFGPAPISNLQGTTGDNAPDKPDSIVVGFGTIVPRWDIKESGSRKLRYFVKASSFPSPGDAELAATAFREAAQSWNIINFGVSIEETSKLDEANFNLVYRVNPAEAPNSLAQAFFPHERHQDVIVFSYSFLKHHKPILKNFFQHEIGHILGLRHEFAIKGDAERSLPAEKDYYAVQFMKENPISVMSYTFPPKIQDSDREQIRKFYQLANGFMMDDVPVTDFRPEIRNKKGGDQL